MQAKRQKLKNQKFADSVPQSRPFGYESGLYSDGVIVSAGFRENDTTPPALRDEVFKSAKFSLVILFCCASAPQEHRDKSIFLVEDVKFLRELVWVTERNITL